MYFDKCIHIISGCPYGDKVLWCRNIGKFYSPDQCKGHGNETCCDTCYHIFHKDDILGNTTLILKHLCCVTKALVVKCRHELIPEYLLFTSNATKFNYNTIKASQWEPSYFCSNAAH